MRLDWEVISSRKAVLYFLPVSCDLFTSAETDTDSDSDSKPDGWSLRHNATKNTRTNCSVSSSIIIYVRLPQCYSI